LLPMTRDGKLLIAQYSSAQAKGNKRMTQQKAGHTPLSLGD